MRDHDVDPEIERAATKAGWQGFAVGLVVGLMFMAAVVWGG